MKITPQQAEALARFLLTIRPEWSKHYTTEAVREMRHISDDLETVVGAAVRGALNAKIHKPDVLAMNGEHWKTPPVTVGMGGQRVLVTGRCDKCGHLHPPADGCIRPWDETREATLHGAPEARAALQSARSNLCPCGVKPVLCVDHRPVPAKEGE